MNSLHVIYLAGGCFWGSEQYLENIFGVISTEVGYANGIGEQPTYEEVCSQKTSYAETVKVLFEPNIISLSYLLTLFYECINPVSVNRQGGDVGNQYRSGIYYVDVDDKAIIKASIKELQKTYKEKIAIEVLPLTSYYKAEEYHQKYLSKNPGGYCHIPTSLIQQVKQKKVDPTKYQVKDKDILKQELSELQYTVTQENATERPFQNKFDDVFKEGIYVDITSGEPLFLSDDKFDSGCGWPSFSKPIEEDVIKEKKIALYL